MNTRSILEEYKEISLRLLEDIKNDKDVSELMKMRDDILKKLGDLEVSVEEKRQVVEELEILQLEKKIKEAIEEEKGKVKEELRNIQKRKTANREYAAVNSKVNFFSTKI